MRNLIAVLLVVACLEAQQSSPSSYAGTYDIGQMTVPTSLTAVSTQNSFALGGEFYNSSGSTITLTISDNGTGCGGSACAMTFQITAGQLWYPTFPSTRYTGGIKWSASATGLIGWMQWRVG